jgi:hypothetical protein
MGVRRRTGLTSGGIRLHNHRRAPVIAYVKKSIVTLFAGDVTGTPRTVCTTDQGPVTISQN